MFAFMRQTTPRFRHTERSCSHWVSQIIQVAVLYRVACLIIGTDFLGHFSIISIWKDDDSLTLRLSLKSRPSLNAPRPVSFLLSTLIHHITAYLPNFPDSQHCRSDPSTEYTEFNIETKGLPTVSLLYQLSPEKQKTAKAEFSFMVEVGICRPSSSLWASLLHLTLKKQLGQ